VRARRSSGGSGASCRSGPLPHERGGVRLCRAPPGRAENRLPSGASRSRPKRSGGRRRFRRATLRSGWR
jgi:hypothetical protein